MDDHNDFDKKIAALKSEITNVHGSEDMEIIEKTALLLEKLNYAPPLVIPLSRFFRLTRKSLLEEVEKLLALPNAEACSLAPDEPQKCQDLRIQFISVLIYYYKKLQLLRENDSETWDEIDELYIHD